MGNNLRRLRSEVSDKIGSIRKQHSRRNPENTDAEQKDASPPPVAGAEGGVDTDSKTVATDKETGQTPAIKINDVELSEVDKVSKELWWEV